MKKILLGILVIMSYVSSMHAYDIGGAYASLLKCEWDNMVMNTDI